MRVVLDRDRAVVPRDRDLGRRMFGVFLFLTYYLQQTLGFTPDPDRLGFLPMSATIMATRTTATTKLVPRFGPRPLVTTGMASRRSRSRCSPSSRSTRPTRPRACRRCSSSASGLGLIFAPAMSTATLGVAPTDAGVASAMVNTSQQVGGLDRDRRC
jgi:hypothetical protein